MSTRPIKSAEYAIVRTRTNMTTSDAPAVLGLARRQRKSSNDNQVSLQIPMTLLTDLLLFLSPLTDSEDVAIRVTHVHLPDTPRLVGRRPGDLETLLPAMLVDRIDVVDPNRH